MLLGLVVLGVTALGLRRFQRSRRAQKGLKAGIEAYEQHDWQQAANGLGRYLSLVQDDVAVLLKYAQAQLNIRPVKRGNIQQAVAAYRNILRAEPTNSAAAMRLCQIYLALKMPGEAELIARRQISAIRNTKAEGSPLTGELRRLLAVSLAEQRKFDAAGAELKSIIDAQPQMLGAYEVLGKLIERRPEDLSLPDFADKPIVLYDRAVENNPSAALAYVIRAAFYLRAGRRDEALDDLARAEKLDLSDPNVGIRIAGEFVNAGLPDKARRHLKQVYAAEPENQMLWRSWARLALQSGLTDEMARVARLGLKELSAQRWDFIPLAAELYIRAGRLQQADDCISKLRQNQVAPATTAFLAGLLAEKRNQLYQAVSSFNSALELGTEPAKARIALARTLTRLGDKQSAVRHLRALVAEQPRLFSAQLMLARLLGEIGEWTQAAEQARTALNLKPDSIDAVSSLIEAELQLLQAAGAQDPSMYRRLEEQLAPWGRAKLGEETRPRLRLLQFQLAMQKGDLPAAEIILAELKKTDPNTPKVVIAQAHLLAAKGQMAEAITVLRRFLANSPESFIAAKYLANLLVGRDEEQQCQAVLEQCLAQTRDRYAKQQLTLLLAQIYRLQNEDNKCYELLDALSADFPGSLPVRRELLNCRKVIDEPNRARQIVDELKTIEGQAGWQWRYEQARLWFRAQDFLALYSRMVSLLEDNLLANPDDQASRMLLAAAHERAGKLRLAVSTYAEALARSPRDVHVLVPAVSAMYRSGEYDRADAVLRRAGREKIEHPGLQKLRLQSYLRRGELASATEVLEQILADDPNNQAAGLSLVLLKLRQNRLDEAQGLLDNLRSLEPNSIPLTVAQIELYARRGDPGRAVELCNDVINRRQDTNSLLLRGRTYAMLGNADAAKADFDRAVSSEPNSVDAWIAKSDFCRSTGLPDEANSAVSRALSLAPRDLRVQRRAILIYLGSADPATQQQARTLLESALQVNPQDVPLRLQKARLLLANGTAPAAKQAAGLLQKVCEDNPAAADAWALLAELALQEKQPGRAMDFVLRGLANNPDNISLVLLKARSEAARSPSLALPTLKALHERYPDNVDIVLRLADTYVALADYQHAIDTLNLPSPAAYTDRDARRIKTALAVAMFKKGDEPQGLKLLDDLAKAEPLDPAPLLARARLFCDGKRWDELANAVAQCTRQHSDDRKTLLALADQLAVAPDTEAKQIAENLLRNILTSEPNYVPALDRLARLMLTSDRPVECEKLYSRLLDIQPDYVAALNNLAWVLCEQQHRCEQALQIAQRGLQNEPAYLDLSYVDLIDTRGVVYFRLGEYQKAADDFRRCIKLYPLGTASLAGSYFHLGRALERLGKSSEAVETVNKAIELNNQFGGLTGPDLAEARELLKKLLEGGS